MQQRFGLKEGDLFMLLNPRGDIYPTEVSPEQGLYRDDTRFLSRLELRIDGHLPRLLSSTIKKDNILFTADLTNPPIPEKSLPRDTIHILREKFLWHHVCYERILLKNYNHRDITIRVSLTLDADFMDIFELRGLNRRRRGKLTPAHKTGSAIVFQYEGLDKRKRLTVVEFSPLPSEIIGTTVIYDLSLPPHRDIEIILSIQAGYEKEGSFLTPYRTALEAATRRIEEMKRETVQIITSNEHFNELLQRSLADICTLVTLTPYGPYPYAGIPWYSTVFGRDGIITALQCLWVTPEVAKGVLRFLGATQAKEHDPQNDAEPGKIAHELRWGEMAATGEVPFRQYYGTVDATPLYIVLAGEYLRRTGDTETIRELWPNILAALRWITDYGDIDGDGFVEYHRHTDKGLVNQAWKDSHDSVFYEDGTVVKPPVAIVEVQGYVYWAYQSIIKMAKLLGTGYPEIIKPLDQRARTLKKNFQKFFWSKELRMYCLALDGEKKPCRVRTSNAGHTLVAGIASKTAARLMARAFMQDEFYSGWGVRTLSKTEVNYNPMSYHNGSVWPHDNALIALGLSRYGYKKEALRILEGLFEASQYVELRRLPELFCGFDRRPGEGPTLYPVACQPQAWASGSVFMLLQAALGLHFEGDTNSIIFKNPTLPEFIDVIELRNLTLMDSKVDLYLERFKDDVVVKVLDKEGDVNIVIYK